MPGCALTFANQSEYAHGNHATIAVRVQCRGCGSRWHARYYVSYPSQLVRTFRSYVRDRRVRLWLPNTVFQSCHLDIFLDADKEDRLCLRLSLLGRDSFLPPYLMFSTAYLVTSNNEPLKYRRRTSFILLSRPRLDASGTALPICLKSQFSLSISSQTSPSLLNARVSA